VTPDVDLLASALGSAPGRCHPLGTGGYTQSRTWRVEARRTPVFVKEAADEGSLAMLRTEALVYANVSGPFLPGLVGFADGGSRAVLVVELLEGAYWPPPYPDDVSPLMEALDSVHAAVPPDGLRTHGSRPSRWERVADDPEPFLGLGLCSRAWLEQSLEALIAAEADAVFEGTELVHNDVYSGNVAFASRGAVLVDWGAAVRGSRWIDVAFALLSFRAEGARIPRVDFPSEPQFASALAGQLAVETPTPLPAWAEPGSTLREDMLGDLAHALGWASELLELPPLL
jgi:thiamine kinase-like enzyme